MKIGIMTFWWAEDNYGQLLQCYALQKYLRDAGHDVYLIRYDPVNDSKLPFFIKLSKLFNLVKVLHFLSHKWYKWQDAKAGNNNRGFKNFLREYVNLSEKTYQFYNELKEDAPEADVYIVGSDQVWNYFEYKGVLLENRIKAYCLDFGNEKISKIAYAASFGKEKISSVLKQRISPLLQQFAYVSVREKSGIDICTKCGVENADWVMDPTMLLDADTYRSLYENTSVEKPNEPYCFLYLLANASHFSIRKVYEWAKEKGLAVIYITGNERYDNFKKKYATIPEWIYLLENAEYVITNSFHCSVFALIFGKEFLVTPLVEKNQNDRFISLFELLGIENRFIDDNIDALLQKKIQWNTVYSTLKRVRDNCKLNMIVGNC